MPLVIGAIENRLDDATLGRASIDDAKTATVVQADVEHAGRFLHAPGDSIGAKSLARRGIAELDVT